jgi:hypothetical protein
LGQAQDAEVLRRGVYGPLASNLASGAQRIIVRGSLRWPHPFPRLPLDSRKRISGDVAVEFPDKEEMNLDQHCCPDHHFSQQFKALAVHLWKQLTLSCLLVFTTRKSLR